MSRNCNNLYKDVKKSTGYYCLKECYRKETQSWYENEYYQSGESYYNEHYNENEIEYKTNLCKQKLYIIKNNMGGVFREVKSYDA